MSTRKRVGKVSTGRRRHNGALSYADIAERLGTTTKSLERYRKGVNPWPEGMKARFDEYERLRSTAPSEMTALVLPEGRDVETKSRRTRGDGELSYANIATAIGMHPKMLERCRQGKRPWPAGMKERYEEFVERRRLATARR